MARVALYVMGLALCGNVIGAQQISEFHQMTASPPNARFQIVQSDIAAKWTFRLDRFTGQVDQLVRTNQGDSAWEGMPVKALPTVLSPAKAHFQLFTSGIAARHTFLLDTDTGKTWSLVTTTKKQDGVAKLTEVNGTDGVITTHPGSKAPRSSLKSRESSYPRNLPIVALLRLFCCRSCDLALELAPVSVKNRDIYK
jgi:hypothetical protein